MTQRARDLRNNATRAERLLWLRLRSYRPRFTRQLPVGHYILDLACREARLAVELDGSQHADAFAYDLRRTTFLEEQGWVVVRLWNNQVEDDPGCGGICAGPLRGAPLRRYPPPAPPFQGGEVKDLAHPKR